jgi:putative ABC transport system permease protein
MISLARATLLYEWRRFLPAVMAVTFAGLLVLVQVGLLLGMFGTVSIMVDKSTADVWMGYRNLESVDFGRDIPMLHDSQLRERAEVRQVEHMQFSGGDWRTRSGAVLGAFVIGVDTRPGAIGMARMLTPVQRALLDEPDAIIVGEADLGKLETGIGQLAEIAGKRVRVVGVLRDLRAIGSVYVIASLSTARRLLSMQDREVDMATFALARLADPRRAEAVRDALQPPGRTVTRFSAWTAEELSTKSQAYWLLESGAGAGSAFASLLGLVVGAVITSQTLYAAIVASIREYATLRALGVPARSLRAVVLEQSAWVGIAGLVLTGVAAAGALWLADTFYVAMRMPPWALAGTAVLVLAIALASGLIALRSLSRAEPATLLR